MYDEKTLVERIEERLQMHLGTSYSFSSERGIKRNTLMIDPKKTDNYYRILKLFPSSPRFKMTKIKEIGSLHYHNSSPYQITRIYVGVDNNDDLKLNFWTELQLYEDRIISRKEEVNLGQPNLSRIILPNETFSNRGIYLQK